MFDRAYTVWIATVRHYGGCKACVDIAKKKATTSALFSAQTRVLGDLSFGENREGLDAGLSSSVRVPELFGEAGGQSITTESGTVLGGIGISGVSADESAQYDLAGISAVDSPLT